MKPTDLFKCLADDTRLLCTLLIHGEDELCVCELVDTLELSQPKVSRHLGQLRACELLSDRRRGQWVFYAINSGLPDWVFNILDETQRTEAKRLQPLLRKLQSVKSSAARCC